MFPWGLVNASRGRAGGRALHPARNLPEGLPPSNLAVTRAANGEIIHQRLRKREGLNACATILLENLAVSKTLA